MRITYLLLFLLISAVLMMGASGCNETGSSNSDTHTLIEPNSNTSIEMYYNKTIDEISCKKDLLSRIDKLEQALDLAGNVRILGIREYVPTYTSIENSESNENSTYIILEVADIQTGAYSTNEIWGYCDQDSFISIVSANEDNFPYFPSLPITYRFSEENPCKESKVFPSHERVIKAFDIIEEQTDGILSFELTDEINQDILVNCYDSPSTDTPDAMGTGGSLEDENKELSSGEINFYQISRDYIYCPSYPNIEIHEILHALGIGHINRITSIMGPGGDIFMFPEDESITPYVCRQLDQEIIECLKLVYSTGNTKVSCADIPLISNQ